MLNIISLDTENENKSLIKTAMTHSVNSVTKAAIDNKVKSSVFLNTVSIYYLLMQIIGSLSSLGLYEISGLGTVFEKVKL